MARNEKAQITNALDPEYLESKLKAEPESHGCAACGKSKCPADIAAEFFGIA